MGTCGPYCYSTGPCGDREPQGFCPVGVEADLHLDSDKASRCHQWNRNNRAMFIYLLSDGTV